MRIGVVGVGYVGLVTAISFSAKGFEVVAVDVDARRIAQLQSGHLPFVEPSLEVFLGTASALRAIHWSVDVNALDGCQVVFVCVGTPTGHSGGLDVSGVVNGATAVARVIRRGVIAIKSTVPVGTTRAVAGAVGRVGVSVVAVPEFLVQGSALNGAMRPSRVVIGTCSDQDDVDLLKPIFKSDRVLVVSAEEAELIKMGSNTFLAARVALINELADVAERVGADVRQVAKGIGLDPRIGPSFLDAGPGYGGSCFPKDVSGLEVAGRAAGASMTLVGAIHQSNVDRITGLVDWIWDRVGDPAGKRFALDGLAFKAGTDDVRGSPAIFIAKFLDHAGAEVWVDQREVGAAAIAEVPFVRIADHVGALLEGADVFVVVNGPDKSDGRVRATVEAIKRERPVVLDLRGAYRDLVASIKGVEYHEIGLGTHPDLVVGGDEPSTVSPSGGKQLGL